MKMETRKISAVCFFRHVTLDFEVACLDISPLKECCTRSKFIAVGLWTDISVRTFHLPDLVEATKENLGGGNEDLSMPYIF